jgi:hypothetical protein
MAGKRQHFVPRLLQRRFAIDPRDRKSLIYRLDLNSGRAEKRNITNTAVRSRYYRIEHEDGSHDDTADELLDRIESEAAPVIARLREKGITLPLADIERLALFIVTQKQRTPEGREQIKQSDEVVGKLWLEKQLSDKESYLDRMVGPGDDPRAVDRDRLRLLSELRSGKYMIESSPSRQVALMFMAVENTVRALMTEMGWTLLRAPARGCFVLSDHPVAHFDPTPKFEGAGAGFKSSQNSITTIPLDPSYALLLQPHVRGAWREVQLSKAEVDEVNLLTYAWATGSILGPTQESVTRVRMLARRKRAKLAQLAKKPPRVWVAEVPEGSDGTGPQTFSSAYQGQTIVKDLYVGSGDG